MVCYARRSDDGQAGRLAPAARDDIIKRRVKAGSYFSRNPYIRKKSPPFPLTLLFRNAAVFLLGVCGCVVCLRSLGVCRRGENDGRQGVCCFLPGLFPLPCFCLPGLWFSAGWLFSVGCALAPVFFPGSGFCPCRAGSGWGRLWGRKRAADFSVAALSALRFIWRFCRIGCPRAAPCCSFRLPGW